MPASFYIAVALAALLSKRFLDWGELRSLNRDERADLQRLLSKTPMAVTITQVVLGFVALVALIAGLTCAS